MSATEGIGLPVVTVVVATCNRASMLRESLHSVLCQTFADIEIIVVDDGSTDDTPQVVESIDDPRVRYIRQDHCGISAARNLGTEHARGQWIAVHDDDDIMLPTRLAEQLAHADDDVDFVYGAFINFDDATGQLRLHHGRNYGYGPALMSGFAPGHSTWLVRTPVMRRFRYDEGVDSAVDNNLAFRMLRSGVRFRHSGVYCLLRRVHSGRITDRGGIGQKYVAQMNLAFLQRGVSSATRDRLVKSARRDWGPLDKTRWETRFLAYLPDHLVRRSGYVVARSVLQEEVDGRTVAVARMRITEVSGLDWWSFLAECSGDVDARGVRARLREAPEIESLLSAVDITDRLDTPDAELDALRALFDIAPEDATRGWVAIASAPTTEWDEHQLALAASRCIIDVGESEVMLGLIPFRSWEAADVARRAAFSTFSNYRVLTAAPLESVASELIAR